MYTAMYAYPWVLADEGVEPALDAILSRAGCDAVLLPFQYHSGKFLHHRSAHSKVAFLESAAHHFRPELSRYGATRIKPIVSQLAQRTDVLREARERTRAMGKRLVAWFVMLHGSAIGNAHPELTQHTVYGDPLLFSFCPSHPEVREFLKALLVDVTVNYEPDALDLESIEYLPFIHDHHHELAGVEFDPFHEALMGLDFSDATREDMMARGVDVERVAAYVRCRLDRFYEESVEETRVGWDYFAHAFLEEPDLFKFFETRIEIISDLAAELVAAVREVSSIPVNSILSWWRPLHQSWLEGHSAPRLAEVCDGIDLIAYFADPAEIQREVVHLRRLLPSLDTVTSCVMPTPPFVRSAEELAGAVGLMQSFGIDRFHFYNYGFLRAETLDWIRSATRG